MDTFIASATNYVYVFVFCLSKKCNLNLATFRPNNRHCVYAGFRMFWQFRNVLRVEDSIMQNQQEIRTNDIKAGAVILTVFIVCDVCF